MAYHALGVVALLARVFFCGARTVTLCICPSLDSFAVSSELPLHPAFILFSFPIFSARTESVPGLLSMLALGELAPFGTRSPEDVVDETARSEMHDSHADSSLSVP